MAVVAFAKIAESPTDDGLFLAETTVDGWIRLGLRVGGVESPFLTVTFNEYALAGVSFNNVDSSHVSSTSDATPDLPAGHVVINS
jgi:hypothetical protein